MNRSKTCKRQIVCSYRGELSRRDILLKLIRLYLEDRGGGPVIKGGRQDVE